MRVVDIYEEEEEVCIITFLGGWIESDGYTS
jgi:hypothetical protein